VSRTVAIAIAALAVLAGLASESVRQVWIQPIWVPVVDLAVGQLLVLCGLIAAVARPQQPAGRRLVFAGFLWIIAAPRQWFPGQGMTDDFLQLDVASFTLVGWSDAVLAFIALSFSARWPARRRDRAMTVALVVAFAFQTTVRILANSDVLFGIQPSDLAWNLQGVADLGRIVALAVAGVLIVQRWRAASGPARHLLGPVLLAGAVVGFAPLNGVWYPFSQWGLVDPIPDAVAVPVFWVSNALRVLVPIAMLVGILRQRGSRAAVADALATVSPATSTTDLEVALGQALRDPSLRVLAWSAARSAYVDRDGNPAAVPSPGAATAGTAVGGPDGPLALLVHDRVLAEDPTLLAAGVAVTRLVLENGRLTRELRRQLDQVRASRARIVESGDAERRRIERDLHDGAQQRLVSLGLQIRRMQRSLPREASILAPALDQIVGEVGSAIRDLRQIAAGVRPARLDDGLAAALHDLARTLPIPVEVEAPIGRVAASVEAAAYFVVCEALTNTVKHASASRVALSATREDGTLRVCVSDDGVGGAQARRGSGLAGLGDRVSAHGGTLVIASPQGGGTRIEVAIPCGS
jgi:signal transduction histidine kinase